MARHHGSGITRAVNLNSTKRNSVRPREFLHRPHGKRRRPPDQNLEQLLRCIISGTYPRAIAAVLWAWARRLDSGGLGAQRIAVLSRFRRNSSLRLPDVTGAVLAGARRFRMLFT